MTEPRRDPPLAEADPEVWRLIQGDDARQRESLRLIASENYVSRAGLSSARRAGSKDGARVTVTTNNRFNLTVHVAGATCVQYIDAGTTTFDCGEYRGGGLTETPTITPTDTTSTPTSPPTSTPIPPLTPPILLSPAHGVPAGSRRPIFTWESVPGATGYTIQIGKNSNFTLLVGTYDVTATSYRPSNNLPKGTLYWRVRANGPEGSSSWSVSRSLVVQ